MIDKEKQIDAVITWVDGNDKNHQKKRLNALIEEINKNENELTTGRDNTRFIDYGELKYCILSIRKFAPWIRTIHLVTDNQVPDFLTPDMQNQYRVNIVDHKEIFESYEWALPTFNSRTIETALWRIPGLAPRFIYFNDDFVITKNVGSEHFFSDGKVILRGKWDAVRNYGKVRMMLNKLGSYMAKRFLGITRSLHLLMQIRSAQLAGFSLQYFRVPHVPHPVRTAMLKNFFNDNPGVFEENIKFRFRNTDQFSAIFLANHLEIDSQNAVLKGADDHLVINGEMDFKFSINRKLIEMGNNRIRFVCLQGFENFSKKHRTRIMNAFDALLENGKRFE